MYVKQFSPHLLTHARYASSLHSEMKSLSEVKFLRSLEELKTFLVSSIDPDWLAPAMFFRDTDENEWCIRYIDRHYSCAATHKSHHSYFILHEHCDLDTVLDAVREYEVVPESIVVRLRTPKVWR